MPINAIASPIQGSFPPLFPGHSQSPPTAAPRNILSRWSWVDQDTITLIASGNFDIDGLPKLHRTQELRNAYLKNSLKGIYQPISGGPSEIIVGTTKLQLSFAEPNTFFLAWHIYVSIRSTYQPERGPGLMDWTERLFYLLRLNYPWFTILNYIIAYYQLYQNSPSPDSWFNPDPTLIAYHLTLAQQRTPTVLSLRTGAPNSKSASTGTFRTPSSDEICVGFNRENGCRWKERKGEDCPRRHICSICVKGGHNSSSCPSKKSSK
jgi:hypothetical protein